MRDSKDLISLSLTAYFIILIIYLLSNSNSHVKSKHYVVAIKYEKVLSKFFKSKVYCFRALCCEDLSVLNKQFVINYYLIETSVNYMICL